MFVYSLIGLFNGLLQAYWLTRNCRDKYKLKSNISNESLVSETLYER